MAHGGGQRPSMRRYIVLHTVPWHVHLGGGRPCTGRCAPVHCCLLDGVLMLRGSTGSVNSKKCQVVDSSWWTPSEAPEASVLVLPKAPSSPQRCLRQSQRLPSHLALSDSMAASILSASRSRSAGAVACTHARCPSSSAAAGLSAQPLRQSATRLTAKCSATSLSPLPMRHNHGAKL